MSKKKTIPGKKFKVLRIVFLPIMVSFFVGLFFAFFSVIKIDEEIQISELMTHHFLITSRTAQVQRGDLVVFRYEDQILIQRCIGIDGDSIYIDKDGLVMIDDMEIDEPYVRNRQNGSDDIYPYRVPTERYFMLNDDRSNVADSRSTAFGSISSQQMIGKVMIRI